MQAQVLGRVKEGDAVAFKESMYNECNMISVAAAIVAQIAITGLSLDALSQTHWATRACFVLSLISALMAVYYATTQQRTVGRLLDAKDVWSWIRGGNRRPMLGSSLDKLSQLITRDRNHRHMDVQDSAQARTQSSSFNFQTSDPDEYIPQAKNSKHDTEKDIIYRCFTPSVTSVITISAPQMLLSGSLLTLLIGLGIYFGFICTRDLDQLASSNDSRNVFISFVVGLAVCGFVCTISQLIQDDEKRSERQILEGYLKEYKTDPTNSNTVRRWGVNAPVLDNLSHSGPRGAQNPT